jgi:hypothetical protein
MLKASPSVPVCSSPSEDPFNTYGTFLSRTRDKADKPVIDAKGLLHYDETNKAT